jgi:hypothetical protein
MFTFYLLIRILAMFAGTLTFVLLRYVAFWPEMAAVEAGLVVTLAAVEVGEWLSKRTCKT